MGLLSPVDAWTITSARLGSLISRLRHRDPLQSMATAHAGNVPAYGCGVGSRHQCRRFVFLSVRCCGGSTDAKRLTENRKIGDHRDARAGRGAGQAHRHQPVYSGVARLPLRSLRDATVAGVRTDDCLVAVQPCRACRGVENTAPCRVTCSDAPLPRSAAAPAQQPSAGRRDGGLLRLHWRRHGSRAVGACRQRAAIAGIAQQPLGGSSAWTGLWHCGGVELGPRAYTGPLPWKPSPCARCGRRA